MGGKKCDGNNFCDESEKQRDIDYYFGLRRSNLAGSQFCVTECYK